MYYPSSIPEKFNPPPPSGVALGGLPPEKQWLRKNRNNKGRDSKLYIYSHALPLFHPRKFHPPTTFRGGSSLPPQRATPEFHETKCNKVKDSKLYIYNQIPSLFHSEKKSPRPPLFRAKNCLVKNCKACKRTVSFPAWRFCWAWCNISSHVARKSESGLSSHLGAHRDVIPPWHLDVHWLKRAEAVCTREEATLGCWWPLRQWCHI